MEPPKPDECKFIAEFYIGTSSSNNPRLYAAFMRFYMQVLAEQATLDAFCQMEPSMFKDHVHIQSLVTMLRRNPSCTRQALEKVLCGKVDSSSGGHQPSDEKTESQYEDEIKHGIRTLVRIGFMLDCNIDNYSKIYCLRNYVPQRWKPSSSFAEFVKASVPEKGAGTLAPYEFQGQISAWKLKKRYNVKIEKTDNIADHLLYNSETRELKIFHQVAYLRALLKRWPQPLRDATLEESLVLGTLPPQLILETLESFYGLLFPVVIAEKAQSEHLLRELVKVKGFDPQAENDIEGHSEWIPDDFQFQYWGTRLEKIHDLSKNPPATSVWMAWLDRHTKERNALIIAIVGLFLAALFGLLGFLVGLVQIVISIYAWKAPVAAVS